MAEMHPEDAFEYKFRNCINDALIKTSTGLVIGTLASLFFMKKAVWPMCAGGFFGFGASTKFCENDLNNLISPTCKKKEPSKENQEKKDDKKK